MKLKAICKILLSIVLVMFATVACDFSNTSEIPDIKIDQEDLTIKIGQSEHLFTICSVDDTPPTISWTSSDTSVLFIDNSGIIIGLKEGEASVTATRLDTNISDTIKVTVSGAYEMEYRSVNRNPITQVYRVVFLFQNHEMESIDDIGVKIAIMNENSEVVNNMNILSGANNFYFVEVSSDNDFYMIIVEIPYSAFSALTPLAGTVRLSIGIGETIYHTCELDIWNFFT